MSICVQCRLKGEARRAWAQGPDKIGAPQSRDKKRKIFLYKTKDIKEPLK
jgi:hypothetical protein